MLASLPARELFIEAGYSYEEDALFAQRVMTANRAREGDGRTGAELERIKEQQHSLENLKLQALAALLRAPELFEPREITFLAYALVIPSSDSVDKKRYDAGIEKVAVRIATEYERVRRGAPRNVSTPALSRAVGLTDNPSFDILST